MWLGVTPWDVWVAFHLGVLVLTTTREAVTWRRVATMVEALAL